MRLHDDPSGSVAAIVNGKDRVAARGIGNSIVSPDPVYPRVDPSLLLSIVFESLELFEPRDFQTTSRYRLSPSSPLPLERYLPPAVQLNVQLTSFRRVLTDATSRLG